MCIVIKYALHYSCLCLSLSLRQGVDGKDAANNLILLRKLQFHIAHDACLTTHLSDRIEKNALCSDTLSLFQDSTELLNQTQRRMMSVINEF